MICSSLNRLRFIIRLLSGDGLYPFLEEFSGLRSTSARLDVMNHSILRVWFVKR
jgi:hypothetical protein